jgi:DNA modification methylase
LEDTPDRWVARLVEVFREVRRVLRDDGTLWVEIGDSYASGGQHNGWDGNNRNPDGTPRTSRYVGQPMLRAPGIKPKDLLGQPWLLAFALRADGWYLRSEIIWHRPNPMPESVTDRPTKAHSTVFLLSKKPRYYYDAEAIREAWTSGRDDMRTKGVRTGLAYLQQGDGAYLNHEPTLDPALPPEPPRGPDGRRVTHVEGGDNSEQHRSGERWPASGANARSVWTIPTEPTPFKHFATWPQKLCQRMILAGTSERGVCPECGAPWVREVEVEYEHLATRSATAQNLQDLNRVPGDRGGIGAQPVTLNKHVTTLGWRPSCTCVTAKAVRDVTGTSQFQPIPATVLDPFAGSGTSLLVARKLGRRSIGIELSLPYCKLAADRLAQQSLLVEGIPS